MYKKNLVTTIALAAIIATAGCGKEEVIETLDTLQTTVASVEEAAPEVENIVTDNSYTFEALDEEHHVKKFANGEEKTYEHFFNADHKCIACGYEKEMTVSSMTFEEAMNNPDIVNSWSDEEKEEFSKNLEHDFLDADGYIKHNADGSIIYTEREQFIYKYLFDGSFMDWWLERINGAGFTDEDSEKMSFFTTYIYTDEYKEAESAWSKAESARLAREAAGQSTGASDDVPPIVGEKKYIPLVPSAIPQTTETRGNIS